MLEEIGIRLKGKHPRPHAIAVKNNAVFPFPSDPLGLLGSKLFSMSGKIEMTRMMMKLLRIDPARLSGMSLLEWVEREAADPIVRQALCAVSRSNSFNPHLDRMPASAAVRQLQRTLSGKAFYLDGGWGELAADLEEAARKAGVAIATGQSVVRIVPQAGAHVISLKDGRTILATSIVVAAGPEDAYRIVEGAEHTSLARWRSRTVPLKAASLEVR